MMKRPLVILTLGILICLGSATVVRATLITGYQEWGFTLKADQSFTCLAYYALGDVDGNSVDIQFAPSLPEWTSSFTGYTLLGLDRDSQWQTAISSDSNIAYIYGDRVTNTTVSDIELFSFKLYYQWDDSAPGFDPNYPIYQDTVLWDGFQDWGDLEQKAKWGKRGVPGDGSSGSWEDKPGGATYSEPYTNPVPEPMTVCLLGFGAVFLRRRLHKL